MRLKAPARSRMRRIHIVDEQHFASGRRIADVAIGKLMCVDELENFACVIPLVLREASGRVGRLDRIRP